jgi:hypothetical protein
MRIYPGWRPACVLVATRGPVAASKASKDYWASPTAT